MTAHGRSAGRLRVGGVDLVDLAEEFGTPLFVYDEAHLRARCREAVEAWGDGVAYATKAFLCMAMARLAHEEGMCLDVSTGGELHVALSAGVPADRLVLHGNNKSDDELAVGPGGGRGPDRRSTPSTRSTASSAARPAWRRRTGHAARPKVLARITPGVEVHTHEFVRTGQDDSKFGFGLASGAAAGAVDRLVRAACRQGSSSSWASTPTWAARSSRWPRSPRPSRCWPSSSPRSACPSWWSAGVSAWPTSTGRRRRPWPSGPPRCARPAGEAGIPDSVRVTAEPGRSIVAAAAITLYRVGTIKDVPGHRTYVSVDGGMSDNPRPVLYGSGYEAFLPRETGAARPAPVRVVGKHCETGDVVVSEGFVPEDLAVGDILATPVTGAYGHSMASNYNKVPRPAVVFVADGEARVVVRRETFDDLVRLDV